MPKFFSDHTKNVKNINLQLKYFDMLPARLIHQIVNIFFQGQTSLEKVKIFIFLNRKNSFPT